MKGNNTRWRQAEDPNLQSEICKRPKIIQFTRIQKTTLERGWEGGRVVLIMYMRERETAKGYREFITFIDM